LREARFLDRSLRDLDRYRIRTLAHLSRIYTLFDKFLNSLFCYFTNPWQIFVELGLNPSVDKRYYLREKVLRKPTKWSRDLL